MSFFVLYISLTTQPIIQYHFKFTSILIMDIFTMFFLYYTICFVLYKHHVFECILPFHLPIVVIPHKQLFVLHNFRKVHMHLFIRFQPRIWIRGILFCIKRRNMTRYLDPPTVLAFTCSNKIAFKAIKFAITNFLNYFQTFHF